jgi:2-polyprenyl-3-methyl-5-hydroxy-6-metoxy-1,4-benzoquinol methylase
MGENVLAEYYREGFGSERHRQGQQINAKINYWAIERLLDTGGIRDFLDVGAGYGFLLKELQSHMGIQPIGVELSQQEASYGKSHLNVDIRSCLLSDAELKSASFDAVACFEVIEHIPNPKDFIDELLSLLKPNGQLLIMTDNFECKVAKDLGAGFPKWIPHSHISHFGPDTLELLLLEKGLEIKRRMSYTPWELWARSYYYKLRGIKKSPQECFDLSEVLGSEMQGTFRFFSLRRLVNKLWVRFTARNDLEGALIYVVAKRRAS